MRGQAGEPCPSAGDGCRARPPGLGPSSRAATPPSSGNREWHLHFIKQAANRGHRARAPWAPNVKTLRELRTTFVDRDRAAHRNVTRSSLGRAAQRPCVHSGPDRRGDGAGSRRSIVGVTSEIAFARVANPPPATPFGRVENRAQQPRSVIYPRAADVVPTREFLAPARRRRVRDRGALAPARRPALAASIVWRNDDATTAPRARVMPSAQMTWRAAASLKSADIELFGPPRATRSGAVEASVVDGTRSVTSSTQAANASSPVQMKDLDPRTIDRLADDVIRRVERRARIERERRGV